MKEVLSGFFIACIIILAFWTGYMIKSKTNWDDLIEAYQKGRLSGLDDAVAIKCMKE